MDVFLTIIIVGFKKFLKGYDKMLNKRKINLMIKLANYDAKEGVKDKKIYKYYKIDYISKKLLFNNLILICILALFICLKFLNYLFTNETAWSVETLRELSSSYIIFSGVIIFVYSLYNVYIYSKEYDIAKKNLENYYNALKKLNEINSIEG